MVMVSFWMGDGFPVPASGRRPSIYFFEFKTSKHSSFEKIFET